ncbi:MAG TPA: hypothetical protein VHP59_02325, partial [Vineibacter terrae]|nr:hypothetical protein [Vineibacter terrae]
MPCPEAADHAEARAAEAEPVPHQIAAPPTLITVRPSSGRSWARRLLHGAAIALAALLLLPVVLTGLYRFVPPPATPLMVIRTFEGDGASRTWVALDA